MPFSCAPCMIESFGVQVPFTSRWRRSDSEAQGRRREAGSEGARSKDASRRTKTGGATYSAGRAGNGQPSPYPLRVLVGNSAVETWLPKQPEARAAHGGSPTFPR